MENQDYNGYQAPAQEPGPDQPTTQPAPVEVPQIEPAPVEENPQPQSEPTEPIPVPAEVSPTSTEAAPEAPAEIEAVAELSQSTGSDNHYYEYIGGGAWLSGVPARNLTMVEAETSGYTPDELTRVLYRLVVSGDGETKEEKE